MKLSISYGGKKQVDKPELSVKVDKEASKIEKREVKRACTGTRQRQR